MKNKITTKISRLFCVKYCPHSKRKIYRKKKVSENEIYERCVMCGELTAIPVSMPIDWREDYEMGFGQLCVDCKRKVSKDREEHAQKS